MLTLTSLGGAALRDQARCPGCLCALAVLIPLSRLWPWQTSHSMSFLLHQRQLLPLPPYALTGLEPEDFQAIPL